MNKKALYERIMSQLSVEVKKVLNESDIPVDYDKTWNAYFGVEITSLNCFGWEYWDVENETDGEVTKKDVHKCYNSIKKYIKTQIKNLQNIGITTEIGTGTNTTVFHGININNIFKFIEFISTALSVEGENYERYLYDCIQDMDNIKIYIEQYDSKYNTNFAELLDETIEKNFQSDGF